MPDAVEKVLINPFLDYSKINKQPDVRLDYENNGKQIIQQYTQGIRAYLHDHPDQIHLYVNLLGKIAFGHSYYDSEKPELNPENPLILNICVGSKEAIQKIFFNDIPPSANLEQPNAAVDKLQKNVDYRNKN